MTPYAINIVRIKAVAKALGTLLPEAAFVGGATIGLYLEDQRANEARPTLDVDVVIEVASHQALARFEEQLRMRGFQPDMESRVICRHRMQGLIVDVMPADESILGFANRWYALGMANTLTHSLDEFQIRLFPFDILLACKLEALLDRGGVDYRWSHDMEDVAALLAYSKPAVPFEHPQLQDYLSQQARRLLARPAFAEEVEVHLDPFTSLAFMKKVMQKLRHYVMDL